MLTASGGRLVIRGEADECNSLDQEAWFLAQARRAGVPVPEVLWVGAVDSASGSRTVMVQTAVTGRELSEELPRMSADQRWTAARACGQVIARLHSVQVGGFYRRHTDGSFEFADYAALQAADLANRLGNLALLAEAGLTPAEVRQAESLLPEAVAARGDGPAVLCHGELFPAHIYVAIGGDAAAMGGNAVSASPEAVAAGGNGGAAGGNGGAAGGNAAAASEEAGVTVTGLIDFGDACGGRPLDDLASLCREWPEVDRAALAAGYGPASFWDDQGRRLALGQLRMLIGYTAHDLRVGNAPGARNYLAAVKAVLASAAVSPYGGMPS